jgi:hypothetical protein
MVPGVRRFSTQPKTIAEAAEDLLAYTTGHDAIKKKRMLDRGAAEFATWVLERHGPELRNFWDLWWDPSGVNYGGWPWPEEKPDLLSIFDNLDITYPDDIVFLVSIYAWGVATGVPINFGFLVHQCLDYWKQRGFHNGRWYFKKSNDV